LWYFHTCTQTYPQLTFSIPKAHKRSEKSQIVAILCCEVHPCSLCGSYLTLSSHCNCGQYRNGRTWLCANKTLLLDSGACVPCHLHTLQTLILLSLQPFKNLRDKINILSMWYLKRTEMGPDSFHGSQSADPWLACSLGFQEGKCISRMPNILLHSEDFS
jgi:hypothetical protein